MRLLKVSLLRFLPLCILLLLPPAFAASNINITVRTILAAQDSQHVDPRLKNLVGELTSVFRYTSYRLLGEDRIGLRMNQTGSISLPGNRVLKITPTRVRGNRAGSGAGRRLARGGGNSHPGTASGILPAP